ncbi:glycosyltransferase family 2 protein [Leisingera sp. ANG59]|uniref:glycosyltransferase family 2 protein n=1 Tax=Leisingera sp. ANG59 TaxID=2675221 RepID=UPI001571C4EF|nr:glycosyltransferase family 2 protein [Leisingera sp. ANG59]
MTCPKLTMTLLVRNEADILADNIRFHHAMGVSSFIVMDNLSTDATPEIIQALSQDLDIEYLHQPADDYNQREWVTAMARKAAAEHGADWVINNDADEFWLPDSGDLQDFCASLPEAAGTVIVPRHNAVVPAVPGALLAGRCGPRITELFERESCNAEGQPLPRKVLHRASATAEVAQGSHRVSNVPGYASDGQGRIRILHYPCRALAQYKDKIRLGGAAYARNTALPTRAGAIWRAQYEGLERGAVEQFWRDLALAPEEQEIGLLRGDLMRDGRVAGFFQQEDRCAARNALLAACKDLLVHSRGMADEFAKSQAELIARVPREQRWERPMYYNLRFAVRSAQAHLEQLEVLTDGEDAAALCARFGRLRDVFSLFPRNRHLPAFLARLLELASPLDVQRLRADCAGKRVILHTSCHPRLQETRRSVASFAALGQENYHHIILLGSRDARPEQDTGLTLSYDGQVLQVPAPDTYEGLHRKLFYSYMLLDLLTAPAQVVKIDDNILLQDADRFAACLDRVADKGAAYAGRRVGTRRHQDQWHGWHLGKCAGPEVEMRGYQYPLPRDYAAGGYGYVLGPEGLAACSYMYLAMKEFFAMPAVGLEDACVGHAIYAQRLELMDISQGHGLLAMPGLTTKERQRLEAERAEWEMPLGAANPQAGSGA